MGSLRCTLNSFLSLMVFIIRILRKFNDLLSSSCSIVYWIAGSCLSTICKNRSNHRTGSMKKGVLKNFIKLTRKHLCQSLLFNKVTDLRPTTLLKKDSGTGVFMWILQIFLEHLFYRTRLDDCKNVISFVFGLKIRMIIIYHLDVFGTIWNAIALLIALCLKFYR